MDTCEDCLKIKTLEFQIKGLDVTQQKQNVVVDGIHQSQINKDIEHEQMIQNLTTRMDSMSEDFVDFKNAIKHDINSIKKEIPEMFDTAINKLLAKMFKAVAIGVFIILCVIILALSRPVIVKGIEEMKNWVETVEVPK